MIQEGIGREFEVRHPQLHLAFHRFDVDKITISLVLVSRQCRSAMR